MPNRKEQVAQIEAALRIHFLPLVPALYCPQVDAHPPDVSSADLQLSRSLALCALTFYCGIVPADLHPVWLPAQNSTGVDAIYWDTPSRRLFFIQSRFYPVSPHAAADVLARAIESIHALHSCDFTRFPTLIHSHLTDFIQAATPDSSRWVFATITPNDTIDRQSRMCLSRIQTDFPHFSWCDVDISTLGYWLGDMTESIHSAVINGQVTETNSSQSRRLPSQDDVTSQVGAEASQAQNILNRTKEEARNVSERTVPPSLETSFATPDSDGSNQSSYPADDSSEQMMSEKALISQIIKSMNSEIRFVRCIEQNEAIAQSELEATNFPSVKFQLANGHDVRISIKAFTFYDFGVIRTQYYSVGVFSSDGTLPTTMIEQHAFQIDQEDSHDVIPPLWKWLEELVASPRRVADYDDLDDFVESMDEQINFLLSAPEDAVEHLEHLPETTNPTAFDKVDDSIYNDQNEPPS